MTDPYPLRRLLQNIGITDQKRPAFFIDPGIRQRFNGNFRSNSAGISHRHRYDFLVCIFLQNKSPHFKFLNIVATRSRTVKQHAQPQTKKLRNLF